MRVKALCSRPGFWDNCAFFAFFSFLPGFRHDRTGTRTGLGIECLGPGLLDYDGREKKKMCTPVPVPYLVVMKESLRHTCCCCSNGKGVAWFTSKTCGIVAALGGERHFRSRLCHTWITQNGAGSPPTDRIARSSDCASNIRKRRSAEISSGGRPQWPMIGRRRREPMHSAAFRPEQDIQGRAGAMVPG